MAEASATTVAVDDDCLIASREIIMCGEVNEEFFTKMIRSLLILKKKNSESPVTIYLNSDGGNVGLGLALHDFIQAMPFHITIVVLGEASSISAIILQAADSRKISAKSTIMLHMASYSVESLPQSAVNSYLKASKRDTSSIIEILEEKTGMGPSVLNGKLLKEWYLSPIEAIKIGLADEIYG